MIRIIIISILSSLIVITSLSSSADDNCINPKYEPYKEGKKLICWMKRSNSNSMDGVLLAPIDSKNWIAWAYQTVFFAEPIDMSVVYNDCNGLGIQGEFSGDIYNLNIEEMQAEMVGTITVKDTLEKIDIVGECQILSEDIYEMPIKENKEGKRAKILIRDVDKFLRDIDKVD